MTATAKGWMRAAAPFVLLWIAVHAVLLAAIAAIWGLAVVIKAVLGWLVHFAVFAVLFLTGIWLALRLVRIVRSGGMHRAV